MARVTADEALQRAMALRLEGGGMLRTMAKGSVSASKAPTFVNAFYDNIYYYKDGDGGLFLPSDDRASTILGKFDEGNPSDGLIPPVDEMLSCYSAEINVLSGIPEDPDIPSFSPTATGQQSIPPMITTKWSQGNPFNMKCVFRKVNSTSSYKCVVGCSCVALAQVLYYWWRMGYSRGCLASDGYTGSQGYVVPSMPPLARFDYENIPLTASTATPTIQKEALATMLMRVGVAMKTDYGTVESSCNWETWGYGNDQTILNSFRFAKAKNICTARGAVGTEYATNNNFNNAVYNNLLNGRPVLLSYGKAFPDGHDKGGHTFVCDGYDQTDQTYHMNLGWGGQGDGYYSIYAVEFPDEGFAYAGYVAEWGVNVGRIATVDIYPEYKLGDANGDGVVDVHDAFVIARKTLNGTFDDKADVNFDKTVTIGDVTAVLDKVLGRANL